MIWRSLRISAWLGWQIVSNWTDPFLFAIYTIIRPLTSVGILVLMYAAVTRGNFSATAFSYMYLGNAFYMYVSSIMTGMSFSVILDRERYRTLKSIYVAPIDYRFYLIGRALSSAATTSAAVIVTVTVGVLFLHVDVDPSGIRWGLLLPALLVGFIMLAMLGLLLSSMILLIVHQSWQAGEAVAGAMYLFSGAIFPLQVLPGFLRPIGYMLPLTYWLELVRRALVGRRAEDFPTLAHLSDGMVMAILLVMTVVLVGLAGIAFRAADHRARERGLIDRTTNF